MAFFQAPSAAESWLLRAASAALSLRRRSSVLAILMFHRVLPEPDPLLPFEPDRAGFAAFLDFLMQQLNVVSLPEGVRRLKDGTLPPRSVSITFDDGYANNLHVAAPLLKARELPATVFVAPAFSDGQTMFNDIVIHAVREAADRLELQRAGLGEFTFTDDASRRAAIDQLLRNLKYRLPSERMALATTVAECAGAGELQRQMLTESEIRELASMGIEIGAHTMNHPILAKIDSEAARQEIRSSKVVLEDIIGRPIRAFAYPNGKPRRDYDRLHVDLVREAGFEVAVTTEWGTATSDVDTLQLPRIAVSDRTALRCGARILRAFFERPAVIV